MTRLNSAHWLLLVLGACMLYLCSAPPVGGLEVRVLGVAGLVLVGALWVCVARTTRTDLTAGSAVLAHTANTPEHDTSDQDDPAHGSSVMMPKVANEYTPHAACEACTAAVCLTPRTAPAVAYTACPLKPCTSLLDALPFGAVQLDKDGLIRAINAPILNMLGFEADELLGHSLHATVHIPEAHPQGECPLCHARTSLAPDARSYVLWSKSGLRVPIEATRIPDQAGGALLLLQDMRANTIMEEKLRAAFTASTAAQMIFDPMARLIDANPATMILFDAERSVLMTEFGRFIPLVQMDGTPSDFIGRLREALSLGACTFRWNWYDSQGNEVPTEVSLVSISYDGDPAIYATLYDLRNLMQARSAVEIERTRLRLVLNASPIGMCVLQDGLVCEHNQCLSALINLASGDVFVDAIVNSARRNALLAELETAGCVDEFEMAVHAPNGGIRQIMLTAFRMEYDGAQRTLCWLVDISRLKEVEHELVIARDVAEEATRAKSNFLARMSHEIRTPMNAIIGMSYLCRQTGLSPHQIQYMDKLEHAADDLVIIFSDILEFTLLQSGQVEVNSAPFSLDETLSETFAPLKAKVLHKGLEWSLHIAPDVPDALFGDAPRLAQILTGVLNNALKFTEQGAIDIRIVRNLESDTHIWLHFIISDTGIGMSQNQVGEIFELFTQGDPSLTRRHGGIGLGLTISKYLTDLLGGRIWAESEQGRGSTFHCTIPFNQPAPPCTVEIPRLFRHPEEYNIDELPTPKPEVDMPDTASSLPGNRVLLVEDNEINQEIACELLRDLGLTPCVVENGQEAVDAVQQESFALIFMDIQMPVMDGLEATRQIRACTHACAHDVPIIAMTAHALQDDREQSFAVGMNAHLTKPIDPGMLQRIVARWLPGTCSRMAVGTGADADQTPAPDTPLSPDAHTAPPHPDADGTAVALGLHSLYGVNVIAGVANVVGNEKLYIDLLRRFAAKYCDSHRELISLISQQDIEGAARLAHTIKGVAANLGAGALADMVKKIETGILSGEDVLNEIEPYRIELEHVTASIDALIQSTQSDTKAAEAHTLDPDTKSRIRAELVALPDLMQTDWGQAQERLDAVAEILDGTPAEPACTRLRNALEEFDVIAFTQAVEAVCAHL